MMKIIICLTLIMSSTFAIAGKPACWDMVIKRLNEPSEKYLFVNHPALHSYINCDEPDLGLGTLIHEAVHFEDLGIPHKASMEDIDRWWREGKLFEFSMYALDGKKYGEMQIKNAPKPKNLILEFLQKYHPEVMANESHTIHSFIEAYLNDPEVYSSYLFTKGLVTELNAYTQGLRFELHGPVNASQNQRYGVIAFLIFYKAYIYQAKANKTLWDQMTKPENAKYIQLLFKQAAQMLKLSNYCENMDEFEMKDLHNLLKVEASLAPMKELLQDGPYIEDILCK